MFCAQCGNQVAEGSAACPHCGAPVGGGPAMSATPVHAGGGSGAAVQGYNFDAARLSQADRIAGASSVVLLISLFLPWYSVSAFGISVSWSGMTAHGYLWIVFILCLAIVAFLVFGAGYAQLPVRLPAGREMILLGATGLNLLLVLLAFFVSPSWRVRRSPRRCCGRGAAADPPAARQPSLVLATSGSLRP
jgi:hypothetical protein